MNTLTLLLGSCSLGSVYAHNPESNDADTDIFAQGQPLAKSQPTAASVEGIEAPDDLVKRISVEVMETVKADADIQHGNRKKMLALVRQNISPYLDFKRMTAVAAGKTWREMSTDQQSQLTTEFHKLLEVSYCHALESIKNQKLQIDPLRDGANSSDVAEVEAHVMQAGSAPITIKYRLAKTVNGWKVYDFNMFGLWLIENYKERFAHEVKQGGVNGLIKSLAEKNEKLIREM